MKIEEVKALFLLAGIEMGTMYELANEDARSRTDSWWLVNTEFGPIKIGWLNKVIEINWVGTPFRQIVTEDNVTKSHMHVHAWSFAKALEYLTTFRRAMTVFTETQAQQAQEA
jgi:hypothetical protein